MAQVPKFLSQIVTANSIAIIVHENADTDALGSAISLKRIIKDNFETDGKDVAIDIFTETENFSKKDEQLIINEDINRQSCRRYDLAIALDTPNRERLGIFDRIFRRAKDTLNIDHHATNTYFAKNNIVATACSSTCELIYLILLQSQRAKCSPQTLSVIYSGIITDTNNLLQNLGAHTFKVVDTLISRAKAGGIDLEQVRNHYFKNNTKEQNALLSRALDSLSYTSDGKIAMMKITKQDFAETNTTQTDTLGIVDHAINTEGVEVGILFIKQEDNTYYVSLRSKCDEVNVGQIAKSMGGGGHDKVAAFQTTKDDNLTDIKAELTKLCEAQFEALKSESTDSIFSLFNETTGTGPEQEQEKETEKDEAMSM